MKDQTPEITVVETAQTATEPKSPVGEADPVQINMWKNRFRRVIGVVVDDLGEQHIAYFRRPDMDILAATNKIRKDDEVKAVGVLFDNCWLGGSELIREDAILKMAAAARFNTALNVQQTELKNW